VEVTPLPDHEDIQLLPDGENESLASEEALINLTHQKEIDDDNNQNKDPGVTERIWESIYPTPDPTPGPSISYLSNTDICLPVRSEGVESGKSTFAMFPMEKVPDLPDIESAIIDEIKQQQNDKFFDFRRNRVPQEWQTAFQTGKGHKPELPPLPENYRNLKGHKYEKQFREAMDDHINEHVNVFKSWTTVDKDEAKGHQIIGCHWIFRYKTDKHGRLVKCKLRLVVRGDQQKECDLPTRATTLATTSLRVPLAMVAKFDLETPGGRR
jgi:hypothetical protein